MMKKKILSLVVVMAMLLSFMPVIAQAATSGECGANLTWTLDDEGTLTISGEGAMTDWGFYLVAPWYSSSSSIKNVIINNGVTSIGDFAFFYCSSLESVVIPDSVTSIGSYAFYNCISLESVVIPDSVTSIGNYAFACCSSLESVVIPDSVTSIGWYAFYNCISLESVVIPDSVTSIGDCAFEACSSLESVVIPDSVTSIGAAAFYNCSSLESVVIPDSVTSIDDEVFACCSSLESVVIPDSVTSIGDQAFYDCSSLESIVIPDSVTSIGSTAFDGCSNLESVVIPDSVTSIGDEAFDNSSSLTDVSDGGSENELEDMKKSQIILTIGDKEALVFGEAKENDVAPKIVNDRTMLPIRFIAEALGAEVEWNGLEQKVTIVKDDIEIIIAIDSDKAIVNGETVTLDSPAFIENERTYLPLRFISENLGAKVEWVEDAQQVIITK